MSTTRRSGRTDPSGSGSNGLDGGETEYAAPITRCCPRCRLPRPPRAAYHFELRGKSAVVGLCAHCERDLARLPASTARKAIARAVDRAVADPGRHWCTTFKDSDAADLACALAGMHGLSGDALQALGWR